LNTIKRDITAVHEAFPISDLFDHFLEKREHIALVVDEYGGMSGIVTMEDVMETLLGIEITDESDNTIDMQALARKNWEQRARRIGLIDENSDPADSSVSPQGHES
jgi:CBS domain containing-hemolysin-like protein